MSNLHFLETIKAENGEIFHLEYHQRRLQTALHAYGIDTTYDLHALLSPPQQGIYRCRVLYGQDGIDISYHPYQIRTFNSLQAVEDDNITYEHKFADRQQLDALFAKREDSDDVVIIKNGLITDTTIANIALFDGKNWITPAKPLLFGTTRQRLIEEGRLYEKNIPLETLHLYRKVAVMNAMMGFVEVRHGIIFSKQRG